MRFSIMHPALYALALVGCAVAPTAPASKAAALPEPITLTRLHGNPGETMEFALTLRGIAVGRVETAVGQPGTIDGRQAIIVKSRAVGEGVIALAADYRAELTTTLDLERGIPMSMHKEEWMNLPGEDENHDEDERTWDEDSDQHEPHSAAGLLRGWQSRPGDRATVMMWFGGGSEVTVVDSGRVVFPVGNRPAVRYDGSFGDHTFSVWISDDTARVPLRMRAPTPLGVAEAELVSYDAPKD